MANIDIDPFGEHDKTDAQHDETGETIPLAPRGAIGGATWQPEREQERKFRGGKTQERRLTDSYIDSLYKELAKHYKRTSDATHYNYFKCKGRQLYFKGRDEPLTNEDGKLRAFGKLKSILCKNRLLDLGFNIPSGKITAKQAIILSKAEEELPSESNVAKADDTELQEITENAARSTEDLIAQLRDHTQTQADDFFKHPLKELLGCDEELRNIRGSLNVEMVRKVELQPCIGKEKHELEEI